MSVCEYKLIEIRISGIPTAELLVFDPIYHEEIVAAKYAILVTHHPIIFNGDTHIEIATERLERTTLGVIVESNAAIGIEISLRFIEAPGMMEKHRELLIQHHKGIIKRETSRILEAVCAANIINKTVDHRDIILN